MKMIAAKEPAGEERMPTQRWKGVNRIVCFFLLMAVLAFFVNATITAGLRRVRTSEFGSMNQIMQGKVNAQVVITGSSRASVQYDPRIVQAISGRTAYNLGRNGSQTDVQLALLKAYLEHNRKPELVIHNLDAFTFVTTRQFYNSVLYVPYLSDHALYQALEPIDPNQWKSRYIPLYGYVVQDMNFSWMLGIRGLFGWSPPEDYYLGFNPRYKQWTDEFERFKQSNPQGVRFDIDPTGVQVVEELIRLCQKNGIQLILVYSPEYTEMQSLTSDRAEIFGHFRELSSGYGVPLWDYSEWKYASNQNYFYNSQHLNAQGAELFSEDLANRLKEYFLAQTKSMGNMQADRNSVPTGAGQN